MLLLQSLKLTNFLSHKKTSIDFKPNQKLLISGCSGAGKSSIIDAIIWVLYNEARSDNRSLIKKGEKSAKVILELFDDEKEITYSIERTIDSKGKHDLKMSEQKEGEDPLPVKAIGIQGIQKYLEQELLHSSYLLFVNSIIYPQNSPESFVNQTAYKRKELLLEIVHSTNYNEYLKKTKEELQERKTKSEVIKSKIENAKQIITTQGEKASKIDEYKKKQEEFIKQFQEADQSYKSILEEEKEISTKITQLKSKKEELSDVSTRILKNEEKLASLNKKIITLQTINDEEIKQKVEELKKRKNILEQYNQILKQEQQWKDAMNALIRETPADRDYDSEIVDINRQLIEAMNEEVEKCLKCGTPYPKMEERRSLRVSSLQQALKERQKGKDTLQATKDAHRAKKEALGACPEVDHSQINRLKQDIVALQPYEAKLSEIEGKKIVMEDAIKEMESIGKEQSELSEKKTIVEKELLGMQSLQEQQNSIQNRLAEQNSARQIISSNMMDNKGLLMVAEDALSNVENSKREVEEFSKDIRITKEDIEALTALKDAFGPNGVQSIVVDYIIPELEERINAILSKLSDFKVRLDTQKGGIGENTVLEGLFITIINPEGSEMDYSSFSGGEKLKITVSISEALAEIQRAGFRVIDELFVGLDEESIEGFKTVMLELQDRFSQMICVSHLQQIKDLFEEKIYVSKINGTSKITI